MNVLIQKEHRQTGITELSRASLRSRVKLFEAPSAGQPFEPPGRELTLDGLSPRIRRRRRRRYSCSRASSDRRSPSRSPVGATSPSSNRCGCTCTSRCRRRHQVVVVVEAIAAGIVVIRAGPAADGRSGRHVLWELRCQRLRTRQPRHKASNAGCRRAGADETSATSRVLPRLMTSTRPWSPLKPASYACRIVARPPELATLPRSGSGPACRRRRLYNGPRAKRRPFVDSILTAVLAENR
jgi:hypothetical protein